LVLAYGFWGSLLIGYPERAMKVKITRATLERIRESTKSKMQEEPNAAGCAICLPNVKDKDLISSPNPPPQIQPARGRITDGQGTFSIIVIIFKNTI
jgi:hypothetical protein